MIKKKCLIVYPYFALYRKHVFDALFASDFGWEFELVGDEECYFGIKGIDPNLASISLDNGGYNWTFAKTFFPLGKKFPLQWQPKVLGRLFKKNYDAVIMLGSIYYISYILAIPILKFFKIPIIFWTHGFLGKDNLLIKNLRHLFYRQGDANLLYGQRAIEIMKNSGYYNNIYLDAIYNSLDYKILESINLSQLDIANIKESFFQFPELPLIIATGRINKEKKFDFLLHALEKSNKEYGVKFNLLIIGNGSELKYLKSLAIEKEIREYVKFTGAVYGCKVYEYLISSDLCVIPGNVGLSAMHALSSGIPVISHNNFDIQMPEYEAIIDGVTGSFYEYNNIDDLVVKIHSWILDNEKLRKSSIQCKKIIEQKYHVNYQIKVIKNCLKTVCNG